MNKKKLMIVVIVLLIVAVTLWIYWGQTLSLRSFFPDDRWYYDMTVLGLFEEHIVFAVDEETAGEIFALLESAELKRGGLPFNSWRGDTVQINTFYKAEKGHWLAILLIEDGRVKVTDFGKKKDYCFRGGEDLYNSILAITEELPEKESSEKAS